MNSKLFNPIKTKIVATIALIFFVLLGAGTIMAMKAPDKAKAPTENKKKSANVNKHKKRDLTVFRYNGTNALGQKDINNWSEESSAPTSCSGTAVACYVTLDGDASTLQAWINARTAAQITAQADAKRN